jgi:hypothetical protein
MKTLTFSLLMTFCSLLSFGQNLSEPATKLPAQTPATSPLYLSTDRAQMASVVNTQYADYFREHREDQCKHAKKTRTVGIILSSIGGGLIITGVALIAIGVNQMNQTNNSYYYSGPDGTGALIGGAFCTAMGLGTAGAGIPLAIIGSVKVKRSCGGPYDRDKYNKERSYMELSTKGNSLALNF